MAYKATMKIGDYQKGDIVPDDKAIVWQRMYDVSPVELVEDIPEFKPLDKPEPVNSFDLNNDGKVDKEDVSLAAKVTRSVGSKLKKGRKR